MRNTLRRLGFGLLSLLGAGCGDSSPPGPLPKDALGEAEGAISQSFESESEPNDTIATANPIPQNGVLRGHNLPTGDKDVYAIPYSDMYDRAGQLWKIWINNFAFRKEAYPGSAMKYDEDTPFPAAIIMLDLQLEHATKASLPSHRFPGEPGWYWHQGEKSGTVEDQFTIAELIKSGH